ncbi:hypothetical protein Ancab_021767 [Ancistrocladus abbreviatus]
MESGTDIISVSTEFPRLKLQKTSSKAAAATIVVAEHCSDENSLKVHAEMQISMPICTLLPHHMVEQIPGRLPIKSLLRFATVYRERYSLITNDSHFQAATLHHHQQSSQCLLIAWTQPISRVGKLTDAYCPVLDHLPYYNWRNYPFVHWKRLQFLGFCNGVAMYSGDGKFCLWNPLTRKYKLISCAKGKHLNSNSRGFYTTGLYYDVSSDEYKVVYMGLDRDIHVESFKTGESNLVKCSFHPSALL